MKWKPKMREFFYMPYLFADIAGDRYMKSLWVGDKHDEIDFKHNLVCKTKKEAIRKANIMLKALKNETK